MDITNLFGSGLLYWFLREIIIYFDKISGKKFKSLFLIGWLLINKNFSIKKKFNNEKSIDKRKSYYISKDSN